MTGRAGYRFVPFDDRIVAPPVSLQDLRLDTPHPDGSVSGTLEITWQAETPVCIGVAGEGATVEPFEIDGCLPGASWRGMLRNVMEIAGFCHPGPINDHRHFGFRDFTDADNYRERVQADAIRAGWLTHEDGHRRLRAYANPRMGDRHLRNLACPPVEEFGNLSAPVDAGEHWEPR